MLSQIGLLSEALIASWLIADERSLSSVHPQVIEEVMPLPEEHSAVGVVALQYFDLAHRPRVFVSKNPEGARRGYCLIDPDVGKVKVGSVLD